MSKVTITVGLPGSGKSRWANIQQKSDPSIVIVTRDDIRAALHGGRWSRTNEKQVNAVRDFIVLDSIDRGRNVIVADTNLSPKVQNHIHELAKSKGAEFQTQSFLDVPLETCVKNDLKRNNSVGRDIIEKMYGQFIAVPVEAPAYDRDLPDAIIVDIDGTLALKCDRSPYDYTRVSEDTLNEPVARIVRIECYEQATNVIIMSGREDSCRAQTEAWLDAQEIPHKALYMRDSGDTRRDSIVKRELFDEHVRGQYNILYVLDDRDQVVRECWRAMGLTCYQVAPGKF